jgi:hypothetical protein
VETNGDQQRRAEIERDKDQFILFIARMFIVMVIAHSS